jgi:hypothetical protein
MRTHILRHAMAAFEIVAMALAIGFLASLARTLAIH